MSDNINKKFIDWDNLEYVLNKMQDFLVSHSAMEHRLDVFYNAREIVTNGIKYANDVDIDNNQKYNKEDYDNLTYKSIVGVNKGLDDLEQKIEQKADKATTLEGYGITDAYTMEKCDEMYQPKGDYLTTIPDEYVTETELSNKNYATKTDVESKQDKLVDKVNIKIINGQSILGTGEIVINEGSGDVNLSNYYNKQEIDAKLGKIENALEDISTYKKEE